MAFEKLVVAVVCGVVLSSLGTRLEAQPNNYVIGPQDLLAISVFEDPTVAGKYAVEADGTFTFPLIGRVKAGGLTLRELEQALHRLLANGYIRNPTISVAVEQYRSQRIFVVGEVRVPAPYPLTGDMTLMEALARAGFTTPDAGSDALILRPKRGSKGDGPILPGQGEADNAEVIQIDLKELQAGRSSRNVRLQDNDTVFVPAAEIAYVTGQVRTPGPYAIRRGMTVQQLLAMAGGITDRGAEGRMFAKRAENGTLKEVKIKPDDLVRQNDTIVVPERFF